MLRRTLLFSNPCRLSVKDQQLVIDLKESGDQKTVPVEDIGFMVLEHPQISISMPLIDELLANNVAVVFCNRSYLPSGMLLNLNGHHLQQELFSKQIQAGLPLKKQLWKPTVVAKIRNQAGVLNELGMDARGVLHQAAQVKSGDPDNREGTAARIYWPLVFGDGFYRERYGSPPNNMLNYGYAILRAAVARALAGSGLLATLGIHHHNRYNAFCLADDIMEPYRPYVDRLAYRLYEQYGDFGDLNTEIKMKLLGLLSADVCFGKTRRPLMIGLSSTTASLARCFSGETERIKYPQIA